MGNCCSLFSDGESLPLNNDTAVKDNYAPNRFLKDEIERPVPLLGENNETTFQKIDVTDSSSDIDTKKLNEMIKTDDEDEDDDEIDDDIEEEIEEDDDDQ